MEETCCSETPATGSKQGLLAVCFTLVFYLAYSSTLKMEATCYSKTSPEGRNQVLATCFTMVFCLAYSSILKMDAVCSSETSVSFQRTTLRYIPEDRTFHNYRCENVNSYILNNLCTKLEDWILFAYLLSKSIQFWFIASLTVINKGGVGAGIAQSL
jgi:hypothetical protein